MTTSLALIPVPTTALPPRRRFFPRSFSLFFFSSDDTTDASTSTTHSRRGKKKFKNLFFILFLVVVILAILFFLYRTLSNVSGKSSSVLGTSDDRVNIEKPKATQTLNKSFSFPLRDSSGKQVSDIKMTFTTAELRDQIVVKGEKATAIEGKTFLILNLKLTNNYSQSVQINTRDYVRLTVNKSDDKLAADIHNDPVDVQAISTKYTRLGFSINDTDKNLVLHIGEINGNKQDIPLHLQ